jgi:hypothetical protein
MRFLIPTEAPNKYNYHLHYGSFIKGLQAHGHEVIAWGKANNVQYTTRHFATALDAVAALRPDVYIVVNPFVDWFQVQEIGRKYPSLIIVGCIPDFHYRPRINRFESCDLALLRAQKHISSVGPDSRVRWYPFSIDEDYVPPFVPWKDRHDKVFFSGAAQHSVYPARARALDILQANPGSLVGATGYLGYKIYLEKLSMAKFSLACQSAYGIQPAKLVEYAVAGTIPLFDEGDYGRAVVPHVLEYQPDQILATYKDQLKSGIWERRAIENREYVLRNHTHRVRARQLLDWIEKPYG